MCKQLFEFSCILLSGLTGGSGLGALAGNSTGRDFDSLSAALSAGNAFNFNQNNTNLDRGRPLGGGPTSSRPSTDTIVVKNVSN